MVCAKCGTDNRRRAPILRGMRSAIGGRVARCGASNEPSEKFCGNCGAQLASQSATSPVLAAQTSSVRSPQKSPKRRGG